MDQARVALRMSSLLIFLNGPDAMGADYSRQTEIKYECARVKAVKTYFKHSPRLRIMCRLEVVQIHLLSGDSRHVSAWLFDLSGGLGFGLD